METFKLPGRDIRLIQHNGTLYKIKLIYNTDETLSRLPCDVKTVQHEVEEAIRVILSGTLTPLKTGHFIMHTEKKHWNLATHLAFTHRSRRLNVSASMFTLRIQARQDVASLPAGHQSTGRKEQASEQSRRRHFEVELSKSSPPKSKKLKSSDKASRYQELEEPGPAHRRYSLRCRDDTPSANTSRPETSGRYHFRRQDQAAKTKECRASRGEKQTDASAGRQDRVTQHGRQPYVRRPSKPHEVEPKVGATACNQSLPAYPQGGVVHHNQQVGHLGRRESEQYQLEEHSRLQRLAGNPQPPAAGVAQYRLRPRGPFQRLVNAVITPVKNLLT